MWQHTTPTVNTVKQKTAHAITVNTVQLCLYLLWFLFVVIYRVCLLSYVYYLFAYKMYVCALVLSLGAPSSLGLCTLARVGGERCRRLWQRRRGRGCGLHSAVELQLLHVNHHRGRRKTFGKRGIQEEIRTQLKVVHVCARTTVNTVWSTQYGQRSTHSMPSTAVYQCAKQASEQHTSMRTFVFFGCKPRRRVRIHEQDVGCSGVAGSSKSFVV